MEPELTQAVRIVLKYEIQSLVNSVFMVYKSYSFSETGLFLLLSL